MKKKITEIKDINRIKDNIVTINDHIIDSQYLKPIIKLIIDNISFENDIQKYQMEELDHICRYDENVCEDLICALIKFFNNDDMSFNFLSKEAQEWCHSDKWKDKKYKFTPYPVAKYMITTHRNFHRNFYEKDIEKSCKYFILSDFTTYLILHFEYHINSNDIVIYVDSEFEKWLYEYYGAVNIYNINDLNKDSDKNKWIKAVEDIMEKKMVDDAIFTNPPYEQLDLKLIKMLIKNEKVQEVYAIHPANYLFGHGRNNTLYNDLKDSHNLKDVTLFWGNKMFGTSIDHAHCISVWDRNYNSSDVTIHDRAFVEKKDIYQVKEFRYTIDINSITVHSLYSKKAADLLNKFMDLKTNFNCDSIVSKGHPFDYWGTVPKTKWGVKLGSRQSGLEGKEERNYDKFYAFFGNTDETPVEIGDSFVYEGKYDYALKCYYFNTKKERDNFENYLKLKCTRFILSLVKHRAQLLDSNFLEFIPWLDWTHHYTEEELRKLWGIDDELWDYIDKFFGKYYEDYDKIAH